MPPADPALALATALTSLLGASAGVNRDDYHRLTKLWEKKRLTGTRSLFQVLSFVQEVTETVEGGQTVEGGPNFSSRLKLIFEFAEPLKTHLKAEFKGHQIPSEVTEQTYKTILSAALKEYARSRVGTTSVTSSLRSLLDTASLALSKTTFRDAQSAYETFMEAETVYQWTLEWIGTNSEDGAP